MSELHGKMRKLMVKDGSGRDCAFYLSTEVKGLIHLRTDRKDYYIKQHDLVSILNFLITGKKSVSGRHAKEDPYAGE